MILNHGNMKNRSEVVAVVQFEAIPIRWQAGCDLKLVHFQAKPQK